MRINELTIGCHVSFEDKVGVVAEISNVFAHYIKVKTEDRRWCTEVEYPDLKPIEITPQYLMNRGFVCTQLNPHHTIYKYENGDVCVMVDYLRDDFWECSLVIGDRNLGRVRYIKYLHQMETFLHIHGATI